MRVWVVSVECGLNGHSVVQVSSKPVTQEEADEWADRQCGNQPYKWRSVIGFGGVEVTELEVSLDHLPRIYDQRTGAPIDPESGYPWEGMGS